jgi:hypothetical protein
MVPLSIDTWTVSPTSSCTSRASDFGMRKPRLLPHFDNCVVVAMYLHCTYTSSQALSRSHLIWPGFSILERSANVNTNLMDVGGKAVRGPAAMAFLCHTMLITCSTGGCAPTRAVTVALVGVIPLMSRPGGNGT